VLPKRQPRLNKCDLGQSFGLACSFDTDVLIKNIESLVRL
jgi:hypothetical protein